MKVLLIEESETCAECLLGIYNKRWFCLATNKDIGLLKSRYEKPSWCPLRSLPKHKYGFEDDGLSPSDQILIQSGWNDCLDEILGETE